MKRIIVAAALCVLAACSLNQLPQSTVNACTTAGMVYEPVQIALLAAVREPAVHQETRETIAAIDAQATGAIDDCLKSVMTGHGDGVKTAVAIVAAATSRAVALLQETQR